MLTKKDREKILDAVKSCKSASLEDYRKVSDALKESTSSSSTNGLILKTTDVADMLGIAICTVRELANRGILKVHYGCGCTRWSGIMKDSVEAYLQNPKHHMRKGK